MSESLDPRVMNDAVLNSILDDWTANVREYSGGGWLPVQCEELSTACLLLMMGSNQGMPFQFSCRTAERLFDCAELAASKGGNAWIDELPLRIAWGIYLDETESLEPCIQDVVVNIDHHNSQVRWSMMNTAWVVSEIIPPQPLSEKLLKNIADTLAWHREAYGLLRKMIPEEAEFSAVLRQYQPPVLFADQYQRRVAEGECIGAISAQAKFFKREASCWRLISKYYSLHGIILRGRIFREGESTSLS